MQALYTETLESFIKRNGSSQAWKDIITKFDTLPRFNFGDEKYNLRLYDLFVNHYKFREVGSEWEEIFIHNLDIRLDTIILTYGPKIQMWLENFKNIVSRKITLTDSGSNANILYPVVTNAQNGRTASAVEYNGTREQSLFMMRSNADILDEAMKVRDMYYEMLRNFDVCFMEIF